MGDLEKAGTIIELALVGGIMFLGYKIYKDLFPGKNQDPKDPKKDGTLNTDSSNPLLNYVADQNTTVNPTGTDLSNLTPTVNTPIGPVGLGEPSIVAGTSARVANAVSWPILSSVWQWSMNNKYGAGWENHMHWQDGKGWVENDTQKATQATAPNVAVYSPKAAIAASQNGSLFAQATSTGPLRVLAPLQRVNNGPVPLVDPPIVSQSMGGQGTSVQLDSSGTRKLFPWLPRAPDSQLDPKYRSPISTTPGPVAFQSRDGNVSSKDLDGPGDFWTAIQSPTRTADEPPKPVTVAPAPAHTVNEASPALPNYELLPAGMVSVNWQSGANSRYKMDGIGWIIMSEADARSKGMIK